MYPASRLVRPDPRSPIVPKLLSLVAAIVLLLATIVVFYVLKPRPAHLVQFGMPVTGCATRFGPGPAPGEPLPRGWRSEACRLVVPNQKAAQRIVVGGLAIGIVSLLVVAAARTAREHPTLA
jgi:hypothetical protein